MQTEISVGEDPILTSVRRRSQVYLGYLFWVCLASLVLWAANATVSLLERWVMLLHGVRTAFGLAPPANGPDVFILGGTTALAVMGIASASAAYIAYRTAWNRRLRLLWGSSMQSGHTAILRLQVRADDAELSRRMLYVQTIASTPEWTGHRLELPANTRDLYRNAAAIMLRSIEADVTQRAITAGLAIGLNRSSFIDTVTIAAAAFELQLHVLTRLGKRPSARTWIEMLKRTSASLFLNSYISRADALYLNLAIRKAALGLEMASDTVQEASAAMADIDWDEMLHGMSVPGLSAVTSVATMSMSVGAFGLRHIGSFIETTANDLLQGVLAGGILYYHGMGLAADCLALDAEHRRSPEMTRTIGQAMNIACAPAGLLLRDQVRRMRKFLRERRRIVFSAATDAAKHGVDKLSSKWANIKESTGFFRETT